MGFSKLVDALLFIYFLVIAVFALLIDSQTCFPSHIYPDFLIDAKKWYVKEFDDYLVTEKPHFFVGLVALELMVQWPLSIANLYAIFAKTSWYHTTCLIQGVTTATSMVAILSELMRSQKASDKLLMMYAPFLGFSLLAVLRGLVRGSRKGTPTHVTRSSVARKKRA